MIEKAFLVSEKLDKDIEDLKKRRPDDPENYQLHEKVKPEQQ